MLHLNQFKHVSHSCTQGLKHTEAIKRLRLLDLLGCIFIAQAYGDDDDDDTFIKVSKL